MVRPNQCRHAEQCRDEQCLVLYRRRPPAENYHWLTISAQRAEQFRKTNIAQESSLKIIPRCEIAIASARKPRDELAAEMLVERAAQSPLISNRFANDQVNHAVAATASVCVSRSLILSAASRFD